MARTDSLPNYLEDIASTIKDKVQVKYQPVNYIQGTGPQYIKTGVSGSGSMKIELDFQIVSGSPQNSWLCLLGSRYINNWTSSDRYLAFYFRLTSGSIADINLNYYNEAGNYVQTGFVTVGVRHTLVFDKGSLYLDGVLSTVSQTEISYDNNVDLVLFNNYQYNVSSGTYEIQDRGQIFNIYSCKMYDDSGVLVRDFIPCYRVDDTVRGMFDKVNKVFYTNNGTGTFGTGTITGEVIKVPDTIPADQFDTYIESLPSTDITPYFNTDFLGSNYTKDTAGLRDFYLNEYFIPEYYPLEVNVNNKIGSSAYKNDTSVFKVPPLKNVNNTCSYAFQGCTNAIYPPNFTISISGTNSSPAEMFSGSMNNYTGDVNITINMASYWPDNMFGNALKIGDGPLAEDKHLNITFNWTSSSPAGTLGNLFVGVGKNRVDTTQPSNYIEYVKFVGLSNWIGIGGNTSWNDSQWDYYSSIFGYTDCKALTVEGFKATVTTYRTHRMFWNSKCIAINLVDCDFSGAYNFKWWFYNCAFLESVDMSCITNSHPNNMYQMFYGCTSLMHIDIRGLSFPSSGVTYTEMFGVDESTYVPANCEIIVKDGMKEWLETKFPRMTNIKTVSEYEGGS